MKRKSHFNRDLFRFLEELKSNNRREWFEENRARYERDVREPMIAFIMDFAPRLKQISAKFVADPRPIGGSMFRVYRDVRFSPDKRPYKTHAAARFPHVMGRDVHAPGFYLHLEPGTVFFGAGIWHPDPPALSKIRDFIVANPRPWKKSIADDQFRQLWELKGEALRRPPKGYDPAHPLIEDLKRKDFIAIASFSEADALSPSFMERFAQSCESATPLMKFLTKALAIQF
ncbi:MAG: hypothetical protein QOG61_468 [Candidatus Binataceae bacterium]|nr:hypothetical protein [Candidatus Binataceae bacterium]